MAQSFILTPYYEEEKKQKVSTNEFYKVVISLASPELIRKLSYGEVKKGETINYRTLRPEKDGLFCERIFGPQQDNSCACGKYKGSKYRGLVCDVCGVEVTDSRVRRERMGHIELESPVVHIWYYKIIPSKIALLLDVKSQDLEKVVYLDRYIVIDPGETDLQQYQIIKAEQYMEYLKKYGDTFKAGTGAEALKEILRQIDLDKLASELREIMRQKGEKTDPKILKRLELVEEMRAAKIRPEWMIIEALPVIPPDLRPMLLLENGKFASSDLNDLYKRIINRNQRLKKLKIMNAPQIILDNEKRMLQDAVDALFDNTRKKNPAKGGSTGRVLKSLADILKGKQGRFRQNLLGKRVDYSGRSVIVVGPKLKLHQCGLPKEMAIELFKPFIIRELLRRNYAQSIKAAKDLVETRNEKAWEVLEEVIKDHPVLLNRAPTLHRPSIQAFEPVLVDDKSIHLHPLVCHAYNADFDGDQMAVHVPLSIEAQIESWMLMLSAKNLLNPANAEPIVFPTQDMVIGIYFLTKEKNGAKGEGRYFSNPKEAIYMQEIGEIDLNAKIKVRYYDGKVYETTAGRLIFNEILPEKLRFINKTLSSKDLKKLVLDSYTKCGASETVKFLDRVKDLGFKYATIFGTTISIEDIKIPENKYKIIEEAEKKASALEEETRKGILSEREKKEMLIDLWSRVNEEIKKLVEETLKADKDGFNPVYAMMDSGARGNREQVKQLAGLRGLMAKPSGEIIAELPIKSNFREGLSILEYFISTHGARKGLADTALKTSDAGYLTRRLVDIAQEVIITEEDCGTTRGITITPIIKDGRVIKTLAERIVSKTALIDIHDPRTGELIVAANEVIDEEKARKIEEAGITEVKVRSVLTCESKNGVCAKCYGWDLAERKLVKVGEAVGIIAAQSIGQPGTQLTMRTFHIGGTVAALGEKDYLDLPYKVYVYHIPKHAIVEKEGNKITTRKVNITLYKVLREIDLENVSSLNIDEAEARENGVEVELSNVIAKLKNGEVITCWEPLLKIFITKDNKLIIVDPEPLKQSLKIGSTIKIEEGQIVPENTPIATFDPYNEPIIAEKEGKVIIEEIKEAKRTVVGAKEKIIKIVNPHNEEEVLSEDLIPRDARIFVKTGDIVKPGDVLARKPRIVKKVFDIVGGLPKVVELFEARNPRNQTVLAKISGTVEINIDSNTGKIVVIVKGKNREEKHVIPTGKYLYVRNGDYVEAGEPLCDGEPSPQDILEIKGLEELSKFLLEEIQKVYLDQGVDIHDKHISIIIRQMTRKVQIVDPGDTKFVIGQEVNIGEFEEENERIEREGGEPAKAKPVLQGLTKASLAIDSFLSAASFQETPRVLAEAAIRGKADYLIGLKENLIIGKLIPAGTGSPAYKNIIIETKEEISEEKEGLQAEV